MNWPLLSILIFLPIAGSLLILFIPSQWSDTFKRVNVGIAGAQMILFLIGLTTAVPADTQFRWTEHITWFSVDLGAWGTFKADYFVAADGLSLVMIFMSLVVMIIAGMSSWNVTRSAKGYFSLMLLLNGAIIGTFAALDFLLFYLFFEFMLLPMYFLIGLWGGPRREYASIKFLLYTLLGSLLILVVLIGFYTSSRSPESSDQIVHTLNMLDLRDPANLLSGSLFSLDGAMPGGNQFRVIGFLLLLIGFAIKVPVVPFHTWLPDAHVEASTPISVILAAILLKVGAYGLLRLAYPLFPEAAAQLSWLVALLGVVSILYGAFCAIASKDLKRLIAYSSVSHMGFVVLGTASLTVAGVSGAVYQMFSHGLIASMLFLIAGVLYDRTNDRTIANYSGLALRMPFYFSIVLIAFFASMGLPGFSGFIGEVMVLFGAFQSQGANGLVALPYAVVAVLGIIFSAGYFLWTIQRMFFGPYHLKFGTQEQVLSDLGRREKLMLLPLAILVFIFGIFPHLLLALINPFAKGLTVEIIDRLKGLHNF